jgi:hypothetical protein
MHHFVALSLFYRMVYTRAWLTRKNMSNTSNYYSDVRYRIMPQWKKGISHDSISNERIVVLMRNDAELNALSDQYRFSLKYFLKIVYFQLILDKYEPNETSMILCKYVREMAALAGHPPLRPSKNIYLLLFSLSLSLSFYLSIYRCIFLVS